MRISRKTLTLTLTVLYLLGMLLSAYTIFNVKDSLIYDLKVIDLSDASSTEALFNMAYVVIGLTMVVGLLAIYYTYKSEEANVIYVEKSDEDKKYKDSDDKHIAKEDRAKLDKQELEKYKKAEDPISKQNLGKLLNHICKSLEASQGAVYLKDTDNKKRLLTLQNSFAMTIAESEVISFEFGEGLVGQAGKEEKTLYIEDVPEGYIKITSGLGQAAPSYLLIIPIKAKGKLIGVLEIASFVAIRKEDISYLEKYFSNFDKGKEEGKTQKKKAEVVAEKAESKPQAAKTETAKSETVKKQQKSKKKTGDK